MHKIVPLILCGGVGKRLRPFSTAARPKPFLKWGKRKSMLQKTLCRVKGYGAPLLSANQGLQPLLLEQLGECGIDSARMVLEPVGRNTAPALAASSLLNPDALLLVLPSDHEIGNPEILLDAVARYRGFAEKGAIITFGVRPRYAETGFGYIDKSDRVTEGLYKIAAFHEKPSKKRARQFVRSGRYSWNSGIFLLSAATVLEELERYEPVLLKMVTQAVDQAICHTDIHSGAKRESIFLGTDFSLCPPLSIDVAVMERSDRILVAPLALDWHDLGSFLAIFRMAIEKLRAKFFTRLVIAPHHLLS